MDYARYEKIQQKLENREELLEHIAAYEVIQRRKTSPASKISLEKLQERYGL